MTKLRLLHGHFNPEKSASHTETSFLIRGLVLSSMREKINVNKCKKILCNQE